MKKLVKILGLTIFAMGISSCAGGKDYLLEQNPPFTVESSYFQKWVAGVKGGGAGTNVYVVLSNIQEEITIKEIYFGNKIAEARKDSNNIDKYIANFLNDTNRDVIMDGDVVKEAQNTPPQKSPFTLGKNEAVISYIQKGEWKFYKISNLEEKPLIAYPSANPNGID